MEIASLIISIGVALTMITFGVNQFLDPKPWIDEYMPDWLKKIALTSEAKMKLHALGNFLLGLLLISGLYKLTVSIISLIWWLSILPFAFYGSWKAGMRDLSIISALIALVILNQA